MYDIITVMEDWMAGKLAMMITWPPFGRWSEGVGLTTEQLAWVPETHVAGKVGYALPPGARHIQAGGFALGVASDSPSKEAAYLFIQWLNSPEISLQRVMLPFALRDPFRKSHFESPLYLSLWPSAPEYLKALRVATVTGQYELGIPGANDYNLAVDAALAAVYAGADPQTALDTAAAEWEKITESFGRDKQQQEYQRWLKGEWNQPGPKE
jgi:multiple sugar transport system substrate-binding protein